ncbi:MAG: putative methylthioribulose-1-phosphate dehydratase [Piptocephalis tieghemiana]|nr:MAG: putative methylthioribulose-1-phosphate dehydratase [Piptocephalis tieghemiana]
MSNSTSSSVDPLHPHRLIPELLQQFYSLGWVTGTGGGISLKYDGHIYIAPSGVQKERVKAEDLFILPDSEDPKVQPIYSPPQPLRPSQCTPLFFNAYRLRGAGACIHTHSQAAVMATLLWPSSAFECTHLEMIKGIRDEVKGSNLRYDDRLVVPIIENTCHEADLQESMEVAMQAHPGTCAILVRRHGVYVWGRTWEEAKTMCECYDYLFDLAVKMKMAGLDPGKATS